MPHNYTWKYVSAKREFKKGRAMGGIITVKKSFKELEEGKSTDQMQERILQINKETWRVIVVYL